MTSCPVSALHTGQILEVSLLVVLYHNISSSICKDIENHKHLLTDCKVSVLHIEQKKEELKCCFIDCEYNFFFKVIPVLWWPCWILDLKNKPRWKMCFILAKVHSKFPRRIFHIIHIIRLSNIFPCSVTILEVISDWNTESVDHYNNISVAAILFIRLETYCVWIKTIHSFDSNGWVASVEI
jgi:hypothetical protein